MTNLQENGVVQYINCELMQKELEEILNEVLNSYKEYSYLSDFVNVEEYAENLVLSFNSDMGKYLNSSDHKILGNFNNIDYDYPAFRECDGPHYNKKLVDDMVNRLNNNDDSSLEASALNYVPGVYTCEVAIDKTILGIEITLDEHHINSVRFTNMTDDINDTYPLLLPTLESIEKQLMADTSPDDVVIGSDSTYTGKLLLDSIENCLTSAKN